MTKREDITETNQDANEQFRGNDRRPAKPRKDAETVEEVNEAANAEFNRTEGMPGIGNRVGGLRGSSD